MTLLIYVLEDNLLSSSDWTIIANAYKQTLTTKCSKQNVVILHCLYMIINVTEEEYISQEPEVHFINISVNLVDTLWFIMSSCYCIFYKT